MKNFNWEDFKKGNIAVHCDTEEKAKDFLRKCDRQRFEWESGVPTIACTKWNECKEETSYSFLKGIRFARVSEHKLNGYKIIKWEIEDMKELTFKEVIANIEEGQAYKCTRKNARVKAIKRKIVDNKDVIEFLVAGRCGYSSFAIEVDDIFTLHRKEYTFQEAFKAYEEGKEIEDCNGTKYKKIDNEDHYKGEYDVRFCSKSCEYDYWFGFDEVRGVWYIND